MHKLGNLTNFAKFVTVAKSVIIVNGKISSKLPNSYRWRDEVVERTHPPHASVPQQMAYINYFLPLIPQCLSYHKIKNLDRRVIQLYNSCLHSPLLFPGQVFGPNRDKRQTRRGDLQIGQGKECLDGCDGIKRPGNNPSHHIRQCEPVLY